MKKVVLPVVAAVCVTTLGVPTTLGIAVVGGTGWVIGALAGSCLGSKSSQKEDED